MAPTNRNLALRVEVESREETRELKKRKVGVAGTVSSKKPRAKKARVDSGVVETVEDAESAEDEEYTLEEEVEEERGVATRSGKVQKRPRGAKAHRSHK